MDFSKFNLSIVGLGLIGGSFAKALRKCGFKNIWALDVNENSLKKAEKLGIIDKGFMDSKIPLSKSDIVIMCLYPELEVKFLKDNVKYLKKGCIVTDVTGVKESMISEIQRIMPKDLDFIPGHPMAGKESKGFDISSEKIFEGSDYILITANNKLENIKILKEILNKINIRKIVEMNSKEHDEMIAYVSQLPHVLAAAFIKNRRFFKDNLCFGGSFRDITRVSNINSRLWSELLAENKENVVNEMNKLIDELEIIKRFVQKGDVCNLNRIFDEVREIREDMI
ncbi:prephenate dehydrogenase [Haloimpatiens sp. FM7315]|uniref:prephenate dehydrogenase n=1 Tax=Haloimpatiens sp. FM7315 TaxID=3298609 RepID=UPI0035A3513D